MSNAKDYVWEVQARLNDSPLVDGTTLAIHSGSVSANQATAFLQQWPLAQFEYAMIEWVSEFELVPAVQFAPQSVVMLERVRLFGKHGDLMVRRDERTFLWRFVGDAGKIWPTSGSIDYWQTHNFPLRQLTKCYYQWRPDEGRVTTEWRGHLPNGNNADLYLKQLHYLDNGRTAFVRYTGFSEVCNEQ